MLTHHKYTSTGIGVFALLLVASFILHKPDYLLFDSFFWISLITLPVSFHFSSTTASSRALIAVIALAIFSFFFTATIGVYCILLLAILYAIESHYGKVNPILLVHGALLSPLFNYFNTLVSFPLRMKISAVVGQALSWAGYDASIEGNLVIIGNEEFLIDKACMGLYMLGYSLLFGTLILAHFSRRRVIKQSKLIALYATLILLVLTGNLVRVTLLVIFRIPPEYWFHEGLGLMVFLCYILFPFYLLVSKTHTLNPENSRSQPAPRTLKQVPLVMVALAFVALCWKNANRHEKEVSSNQVVQLAGYQREALKNGVVKFSDHRSLIYVKPPVPPYRADHNPMICWQGSGYDFGKVYTQKFGELLVNLAELKKGDETLYTSWWFDTGDYRTGSQWGWRWEAFKSNKAFYLVNLTCTTKNNLSETLQSLLRENNRPWFMKPDTVPTDKDFVSHEKNRIKSDLGRKPVAKDPSGDL